MALTPAWKGRVDEAVARIHGHFGETVYVRRLVPSGPDDTYSEDMTRVESEAPMLAIVNQDIPRRILDRFGRRDPVDLMVTFSYDELQDSGVGYVYADDVIVWRGRRHTVVQVNEVPKVVLEERDERGDVVSEFIELSVLAVISEVPENPEAPPTPSDPAVAALIDNASFESGGDGWTLAPGSEVSTAKANNGMRSYHQTPTARNQFSTQDLTGRLTPGRTYTIDTDAFAVGGVPTTKIKVGDDEYMVSGEAGWVGDGAWHRMPQLQFTAPTNPATPVTLSIGQGTATEPGEFYVDQVLLGAPADARDDNDDDGGTAGDATEDENDAVIDRDPVLQRAEFIPGQFVIELLFDKDVARVGDITKALRVTVEEELVAFGGVTQDTPRKITLLVSERMEAKTEVRVWYRSLGGVTLTNAIVLAGSDPLEEIDEFHGVDAKPRSVP